MDSWVRDISGQLGYRHLWTVGLETLVDSWVTDISGQLGYRRTFCQNAASTKKNPIVLIILKSKHAQVLVNSGSLKVFLSRKTVYRRVTTDCCFMRYMSPISIVFYPKCRHAGVGIYHHFLIVNVLFIHQS